MELAQDISLLVTEQSNPKFHNLDRMPVIDILKVMNTEDQSVPIAVSGCLEVIASAIEQISIRMDNGGRLFYVGAGTSGRLGMIDAYECPLTFGTDPELVQSFIAGKNTRTGEENEEAEDDMGLGADDLMKRGLTSNDIVLGIAASGRTPYVIGALEYAKKMSAGTISLSCNLDSAIGQIADIAIEIPVGSEVLAGSTRLKSGTAQKLVLNMISTALMVGKGKIYRNLMVDLQPVNDKLRARSKSILKQATGKDDEAVAAAYEESGENIKVSIVMLLNQVRPERARHLLEQSGGWVRKALELSEKSGV